MSCFWCNLGIVSCPPAVTVWYEPSRGINTKMSATDFGNEICLDCSKTSSSLLQATGSWPSWDELVARQLGRPWPPRSARSPDSDIGLGAEPLIPQSLNLVCPPPGRAEHPLDARATPCYEVLVGGEHRKGAAMRPASELLTELSQKAKAAEDDAADVKSRNRAKLEARRNEIEASLDEDAAELDAESAEDEAELDAEAAEAAESWRQIQSNLRAGFKEKKAAIKAEIDAQKAARDAKRAAKRANRSEAEADIAVQIALGAIEQAEYAVLDAVLARADADAVSAS